MKNASTPPSLTKSLMAGFDVIANHVSLILFPILLDVFLWFGPQLRLMKLIEPLFREAEAIPEMQANGTMDLLRLGAKDLNLLAILRTFPIGVPSLIAGRSAQVNPLSQNPTVDLSSVGLAFGLWFVLVLIGVGVGTLFFSLVAQAAQTNRINLREALARWPRHFGNILLLTLFWYLLIAAFLVPFSCLMSILVILGLGAGRLPLIIAVFLGGLIIWMLIPLFFSPHGIFVQGKTMWESTMQGIRLSRVTYLTSFLLILAVVLLSEGMNVLWNYPKDDSWFLLIGIFGHAFITTSLLATTFVYYQKADLWLRELIRQKDAHRT